MRSQRRRALPSLDAVAPRHDKCITTALSARTTQYGTQGSADGTGAAATFYAPSAIAIQPTTSTTAYVADTSNNEIRAIVLSSGAVTTLAGTVRFLFCCRVFDVVIRLDRLLCATPPRLPASSLRQRAALLMAPERLPSFLRRAAWSSPPAAMCWWQTRRITAFERLHLPGWLRRWPAALRARL